MQTIKNLMPKVAGYISEWGLKDYGKILGKSVNR